MAEPGLAEKVAFLGRPESYLDQVRQVDLKETHMSYVFLTDQHAWKLKKPVANSYLDFTTVDARRCNCARELDLNRRLAPGVYLGMVPLVIDLDGRIKLGGEGRIIDWLVKMRRLPAERMLDRAIENHTVSREDVHKLGVMLAHYYEQAPRIRMSPAEYRQRLENDIHDCAKELRRPEYALSSDQIESIRLQQAHALAADAAMFDDRVKQGRIVDAHGDLRPEHICLSTKPVVIDCLEFSPDFRILDAVSELSYFTLECERLGAKWVGDFVFECYRNETGDFPPADLIAFYTRQHACTRAKIAVWHLKDPAVRDRAKWIEKARAYLDRAVNRGVR
ncbi:MAG: hypothetical protein LAO79_00400 [Acidobacteriia bacterium]|nr:hypothetical protein [Terriglobia bacterium]